MRQRTVAAMVAACVVAFLTSGVVPSGRATGAEPVRTSLGAAATRASHEPPARHRAPRFVLYGDSLVSEAGQDFVALARQAGAAVQVHTFPGTSPCNFFPSMVSVARTWHPTVALLAFTGNAFTPCMDHVVPGTAPYFAKYTDQTHTEIATFRSAGARVVLVGQPVDASANLSKNGQAINRLYQSIAKKSPGVTYDDAGRAVLTKGKFTWTLPCVRGQPCTGPHGTNIVRSPDGVHFCPSGQSTPDTGFEQCDVYSSGAFRFALAMVRAALGARTGS